MTQETALVNRETGEIEARPSAIRLSNQAIAIISENIALAENLVNTVLEPGVDFGTTPGTKGPGLWDPGASKIMAAYNCFAKHNVIYHSEADDLISWTIETELISRDSQKVVGTGVGGCSTREVKYHYRWSKNPAEDGYTTEEINQLKKKTYSDGNPSYRIDNPDPGDLSHTILVMAAKRSEIDAVKSLPGVNSALRKMFDPERKPTPRENSKVDWKRTWSIIKGMGINEADAHRILGVASLNDWEGTPDDAIIRIGKTLTHLIKKSQHVEPPANVDAQTGEIFEPEPETKPVEAKVRKEKPKTQEPAPDLIDMDWLKESLEKINWTGAAKWLHDHYDIPIDRISVMVGMLTKPEADEFTKEVQDRLEMS